VDTNVERVLARLHGVEHLSRAQAEKLALNLMPSRFPGDFVQAMMDLGATICRPKKPNCRDCPIRQDCAAFAAGAPESFPRPRQRPVRPHRHGVAYWTQQRGKVWLVRRRAKGLLGGMAALPGSDWTSVVPDAVNAIGTVRHVFTHFSLDLHIVPHADPQGDGWWQPLGLLGEAGLPTLYRRAAELVLSMREAA
jgi:A/G-specific adenine glycosylase